MSVDTRSVTIGSDRVYAAIQQLGGVIKAKGKKPLVFTIGGRTLFARQVKIPARPFFPFTPDGQLAAKAVEPIREALQLAYDKAMRPTG